MRTLALLALFLAILLTAAAAADAQPADHDYSRTTYTAEATFIYAQPDEGRIVEMVPAGAIVGVDVCDDG